MRVELVGFVTVCAASACGTEVVHEAAVAPTTSAAQPTSSGSAPTANDAAVRATVYVPIYSNIATANSTRTTELTATVSVRNTDWTRALQIDSAEYYDSAGARVRGYLDTPMTLGPMASTEFVVERTDSTGGAGANFIVEWSADGEITEPVIEAVMIGAANPPGVSFVSPGRVIDRRGQ